MGMHQKQHYNPGGMSQAPDILPRPFSQTLLRPGCNYCYCSLFLLFALSGFYFPVQTEWPHFLTYHSSTDESRYQSKCSQPITPQHEAHEDEGYGEPEVVVGLPWHHLDIVWVQACHRLDPHNICRVGTHGSYGWPLQLHGVWWWLIVGRDERCLLVIFLLKDYILKLDADTHTPSNSM
jgi:hypothetical protein